MDLLADISSHLSAKEYMVEQLEANKERERELTMT